MTLCISITSACGAWLCSDRRLCDDNFEPICDDSRKQTILACTDGFAVMSVVGLAAFSTPFGVLTMEDWLQRAAAVKAPVLATLELIATLATRQLTPMLRGEPQQIVGVAVADSLPFTFTIQNVHVGSLEVVSDFVLYQWEDAGGLLARAGSWNAVPEESREALRNLATQAHDRDAVSGMLADAVRQASHHSRLVSPTAFVTYLPRVGAPCTFEFEARHATAITV